MEAWGAECRHSVGAPMATPTWVAIGHGVDPAEGANHTGWLGSQGDTRVDVSSNPTSRTP